MSWWRKKWAEDIDPAASAAAVKKAERHLQRANARWPIVEQIAAELAEARAQNNFAARIRAAYGEGR